MTIISCFPQIFAAAAVMAVSGNAVYHAPAVTTQYHSQDEWGQYAYGYSGGPSAKHEQRTADGVTRGGYSYVDANGLVQSVSYVSDPVNGFRAAGTNFPTETKAAPAAVPVQQVVHHEYVPASAPVPVPVHHDYVVPVSAHVPVSVHPWPVATHPGPTLLPAVVDARNLHAAKLSQPLTPAGTKHLHYPEHAVFLGRKKRSAVAYPYPLLSEYAAPAKPAHVVTVKHAESAAPHSSVLLKHHNLWYPAPPAPVATSYTSVVRHHSAPAVPVYAAPVPVYDHHYVPVTAEVPYVYSAPVPAVVPVPVANVPVKTQYHSQDEHGQYTYGYTDGASAKTETRFADGMTKGSYSYVDDHGAMQAVHYTAGADGFQAVGTNIPVHHV